MWNYCWSFIQHYINVKAVDGGIFLHKNCKRIVLCTRNHWQKQLQIVCTVAYKWNSWKKRLSATRYWRDEICLSLLLWPTLMVPKKYLFTPSIAIWYINLGLSELEKDYKFFCFSVKMKFLAVFVVSGEVQLLNVQKCPGN